MLTKVKFVRQCIFLSLSSFLTILGSLASLTSGATHLRFWCVVLDKSAQSAPSAVLTSLARQNRQYPGRIDLTLNAMDLAIADHFSVDCVIESDLRRKCVFANHEKRTLLSLCLSRFNCLGKHLFVDCRLGRIGKRPSSYAVFCWVVRVDCSGWAFRIA